MEWLFGHMEDPDIDVPLDLGATNPAGPEKIAVLESMGLGGPRAIKALKETNGDVERAIEWLFSHPDDQGDSGEADQAGDDAPKGDTLVGSSELPANFQLQSIVCHKGTSIHAG
jgi:ubiquitin carboxyl-terminal hydrolase 5/13